MNFLNHKIHLGHFPLNYTRTHNEHTNNITNARENHKTHTHTTTTTKNNDDDEKHTVTKFKQLKK